MTDELDLLEEKKSARVNPLAILKRRRWYILAPLLISGLIGSIVAEKWPLLYQSDALILVEQQKVPEQYVTPNVITSLQTRLDGMTQEILSRTRLQRMIEDFGLYKKQRERMTMDVIVDMMRSHIIVKLVQTPGQAGGVTGFRIMFAGENARMTQRITNELTSLFIDQSLRERTRQSASTTQFLENELGQAQKDLSVQEQRLREYKMQFIGELPEQQQGNLQILSSLEAQLYSTEGALQRAEQQKTYFEAMKREYEALSELKAPEDAVTVEAAVAQQTMAQRQIDQSLVELQKQLAMAKTLYTSRHPAIQELEAQIDQLKKMKTDSETATEAEPKPAPKKTASVRTQVSNTARLNVVELDSRIKASDVEIANDKKNVAELHDQIEQARKRINMTPMREQQLSEITRTHENSRAHYQSLLQKKLQSELASNLERRQGGEQFRILDPANLPERPEGRLRILGIGWVVGIGLGLGLALLREFTAQCVNDHEDVKQATDVPIFEIPVIRSPKEHRKFRLKLGVEVAAGFMIALAAFGASIRTYLMS